MRNRNLISMIYENLEKTSAAAEKSMQLNAIQATAVGACCCDRWGHPYASDLVHQKKYGPTSPLLPTGQ